MHTDFVVSSSIYVLNILQKVTGTEFSFVIQLNHDFIIPSLCSLLIIASINSWVSGLVNRFWSVIVLSKYSSIIRRDLLKISYYLKLGNMIINSLNRGMQFGRPIEIFSAIILVIWSRNLQKGNNSLSSRDR